LQAEPITNFPGFSVTKPDPEAEVIDALTRLSSIHSNSQVPKEGNP